MIPQRRQDDGSEGRPEVSEQHEASDAIGTVTHWYAHLSVAAIRLTAPLAEGDRIHIRGHTTDLVETVRSMEIDHRRVERAEPGDDVALAVEGHVPRT
jgi:translation elongation factor EF-1alpha